MRRSAVKPDPPAVQRRPVAGASLASYVPARAGMALALPTGFLRAGL
jgi:hypothetical protein